MGGYFSGRHGGRPTANLSKRIDLTWMLRTGRAVPGEIRTGVLSWSLGGEPAGSISYVADMLALDAAELRLSYTRGSDGEREQVRQTIRMVSTAPNYGGRRWWMVCPFRGNRIGKLYLPAGGDRFAGRLVWRLGYQSQRVAKRDRPFEALYLVQRRLRAIEGWDNYPTRPKGMWQRTYARHMADYDRLNARCSAEMMALIGLLRPASRA